MTPRDADVRHAGQEPRTPDGPGGRSGENPAGPGRNPASREAAAQDATQDAATRDDATRDDATRDEAAELRARVAELEDLWRRALADLDNLRKRTARDAAAHQAAERARAAAEWLPVLDNLDLALQHAEADPASIVKGVEAVRDQALAVLAGLGFARRDDDVGAPFDPARHEAAATVTEPDAAEGTVVRVLRPGYGDGEQQLRPAAVVVATKAP
jgi:molecular chaperone GrpE